MTSFINTGGSAVANVLIHDLLLQDFPTVDQAIDMFGGDGAIYSCTIREGAIVDTGIRVDGGPWRIHNNHIITDDTGILLLGTAQRCVVADNTLGGLFKADGILVEGDDNIITGNLVEGAPIRITGDDNLIVGNTFRSLDSANNGFIIAGDRNVITGNKIVDEFGAAPAVGIQILAGATGNIIGINDLEQATTPISDAGTNTVYNTLTTKGDLRGFDTDNARIPVGTNDQILIADSAQTLGIRWGAAPTAADTRVTSLMLGGM